MKSYIITETEDSIFLEIDPKEKYKDSLVLANNVIIDLSEDNNINSVEVLKNRSTNRNKEYLRIKEALRKLRNLK